VASRASVALVASLAFLVLTTGAVASAPTHAGLPSRTPTLVEPSISERPVATRAAAPASNESISGQINWATYMGSPEHTGANLAERTIAPSNVSNLSAEWTFETNGSDLSAPIVVNGTVYFGSWAGYEYAVNAANGSQIWDSYLGYDPDCSVGGIESTPAYSNGSLYLGAPNGSWDALNASTGSLLWSYFVANSSLGNFDWASAEVYGHSLYIGEASCDDHPLVSGRLIQVNLTGNHTANHTWNAVPGGYLGTTIWTTATADPATNTIWSSTGNDDGIAQEYAQSMVALNATNLDVLGSWQVPNVVGQDDDFGSTATMVNPAHGPPLVVATDKNGVTYAFNRSNVTDAGWGPVWTLNVGGGWGGAAYDGSTLFVLGQDSPQPGTLFAVDPSNGSVLWHTDLRSGFPYAAVTYANGIVYVGAQGTEYAVDAITGTILWSVNVPTGSVVYGESVVADGRLYVASGTPNGSVGEVEAFGLPLAGSAFSLPSNNATPQVAEYCANATGGMLPYTFHWTFDDGGSAYGACVEHTFQYAGTHYGRLVLTDQAGGVIFSNASAVTENPPPVLHVGIRASSLSGEAPFQIWLNGTAANGTGPPYVWNWTFGDGTTGSGSFVTHTYEHGGTFPIQLNVSEPGGEMASTVVVASVLPPLVAPILASPLSGEVPLTTTFSVDPAGGLGPYSVSWTFGDGSSPSTGESVSHTYDAAGNFTANATVTDHLGIVLRSFVVVDASHSPPGASGMPLLADPSAKLLSSQCHPSTAQIQFTANASGGVAPLSERWTFGDGSAVGTGAVVVHTYPSGRLYNATLTVNDSNGSVLNLPIPVFATPSNCSSAASVSGISVSTLEIVGAVAIVVIAVAAVVLLRRRPPT
jgi:PKD repeat protein